MHINSKVWRCFFTRSSPILSKFACLFNYQGSVLVSSFIAISSYFSSFELFNSVLCPSTCMGMKLNSICTPNELSHDCGSSIRWRKILEWSFVDNVVGGTLVPIVPPFFGMIHPRINIRLITEKITNIESSAQLIIPRQVDLYALSFTCSNTRNCPSLWGFNFVLDGNLSLYRCTYTKSPSWKIIFLCPLFILNRTFTFFFSINSLRPLMKLMSHVALSLLPGLP